MAIKIPNISWEAIISNTSVVSGEDYRYNCILQPININDPGYGELEVGYYIVDYIGHIFEIEEISGYEVKVHDLLKDSQFTGPYNDKNGYVYGSLQEAALLAQAKLNRLDQSAEDFVRSLGLDPKLLEVDFIDFTTDLDPLPEYKEGRLFYNGDDDKKALSYYNDVENVTVNIGQELLIRVKNETGSTITNGTVVYPTGVCPTDNCILIDKADAHDYNKSRLVGVVTHSIENGSKGWVTKFGEVGGLDTTIFTNNILYLSADTPGALTTETPDDGSYLIEIGAVKNTDAVNGSIVVDVNTTELTVEVTDTNGFPKPQKDNTTISFNESTREFTIAPVSGEFHFYELGIKYEHDTAQTVTIPDSEGLYVIYFDKGVLTSDLVILESAIEDIVLNKCIVSYIYWDYDNKKAVYFGEERHGISMSPYTHVYLHTTRGTQFLKGLGLSDFNVDGNGSLNSHAKFSSGTGKITDEDLITQIPDVSINTGLPIYYLEGDQLKRYELNTGYSVLNTGSGRLAWNESIAGNYQLSEVPNNNYVLYHVFATGAYPDSMKLVSIMGQNYYSTSSAAKEAASSEINSLVLAVIAPESIPIGTVIFQTKDSYSNDVKARIVSTENGEDYIDWRYTELSQGASPTVHGNLVGLNEDDHKQYALLDGRTGDVLNIDQINEFTTDAGVTVDGALIKDGEIDFPYLDKYTNTEPMPEDVGGAEAGTTFNEQRIDQVLTTILYPYQYPEFTAFSIQSQSTVIEVGDSIAADRTFLWTTDNDSNIQTNTISIYDITAGTTLASGLTNDGSELVTMSAITKTIETSNRFRIEGTNTKTETFTKDYLVYWRWGLYYGESTLSALNETGIEGLRVNELDTTYTDTYSFEALSNGYKYICYPSEWGTATSFTDTSTGLSVPMEDVYTVSVTNSYGITTDYNVHRSTNILNDAINIAVA